MLETALYLSQWKVSGYFTLFSTVIPLFSLFRLDYKILVSLLQSPTVGKGSTPEPDSVHQSHWFLLSWLKKVLKDEFDIHSDKVTASFGKNVKVKKGLFGTLISH